MRFFYEAKASLLFSLIFLFPTAFNLLQLFLVYSNSSNQKYGTIFLIVSDLLGMLFVPWLYVAGRLFYQNLKDEIHFKFKGFEASVFIMFVAYLFFHIVEALSLLTNFHFFGFSKLPAFIVVATTLYPIFFVAKISRTISLGRVARLKDYFADFLMLFFFPIGVWYFQPKINSLAMGHISKGIDSPEILDRNLE